nr:hydroxyethylthiazole kinase [Tessaracoccus coleopterorum]
MTNTVVPEITANVLLAIGAAPAMIDLPEEAGIFAGIASALLINVGNGSAEQHRGMRLAAPAAEAAGRPWVLDPVAVGALPIRTALARDLLAHRPRPSAATRPRSWASQGSAAAAAASTPPTTRRRRSTPPSTSPGVTARRSPSRAPST